MQAVLSRVFGNGALPEELKGELRTILLQMRNERNAFESAAERATNSMSRAEDLAAPVARIEQSLEQFETRLKSAEDLASRLSGLGDQTDSIAATQANMESQAGEADRQMAALRSDLEQLHSELGELRQIANQAVATKPRLDQMLELGKGLEPMRGQMADLSQLGAELRESMAALRREQEENQQQRVTALSQLASMEERYAHMADGFRATDERASKLEATVDALAELAAGVPDVRRELSTLKALSDYVAQKVSELELQREAVDRASSQGERFAELLQRIDRDTKTQLEKAKSLTQLREEVEGLGALQAQLIEQTDVIAARQRQIAAEDETRRQELNGLRDGVYSQIREAIDRFEFEKQGLDTTSAQVADLRNASKDLEQRFEAVEATDQTLSEIQADMEHLGDRVARTRGEVAKLEREAGRVSTVNQEIRRVEHAIQDVSRRLIEVREPATTSLDVAEERLADLEATMQSLEARARELQAFADSVRALTSEADQRETSLERALSRLNEVAVLREEAGAKVNALDERSRELGQELTAAEERIEQIKSLGALLDRQAENLQPVSERIAQFENRLAKWQATEAMLTQALDDATGRQATVDALRSDIHHLFEIADETTASVRAIVGAREELEQSRTMLDSLVAELNAVRHETDRLEERNREISGIEEKIARAEALMIDVGSSLETLNGQKVFLDQVMETAGSLRFHVRQAEALISTMREEQARPEIGPTIE